MLRVIPKSLFTSYVRTIHASRVPHIGTDGLQIGSTT